MRERAFGAGGPAVPVVGMGTWQMEDDPRAAVLDAVRRGLDAGLRHVDTAEMYGDGAVETLLGEALAGRRDEVFLVSKVLPRNASREGVVAACERSLRRLRTDRLDGYLLHWPGEHPFAETLAGFQALQEAGKIRAFGVSNFDVAELEEAVALAGPGAIACNQVLYHLEERGIEHRVLPWCAAHGIAVVAYSPFGSGRFPGPRSAGGRVLEEIARTHGASPRQVALAFLLRHEDVLVIPKAARPEHARANAAAGDLVLAPDERARLEHRFPVGRPPRALPTL